MKERGSSGGNQRANRVGCIVMGGRGREWELGGQGAPCENESIPGDCAWEGCSEDAHDCFKVPLYTGNESGSGGTRGDQVLSSFSERCACCGRAAV